MHPTLFFKAEDISELRERAKSGVHRTILNNMIANAERRWDWELTPPTLVPPDGAAVRTADGRQDWDPDYTRAYIDQYRTAQIVRNHAEFYSLLYLLTEKERYLDRAKYWVLGPCEWSPATWTAYSTATRPLADFTADEISQMEHSGGAVVDSFVSTDDGVEYPVFEDTGIFTTFKLRGIAIGYDWLSQHLNDSERALVRGTLIREAERLYRNVKVGRAMLIGRILNHTWFDVSQFGITAAALVNEHEPAREWLRFARDHFVETLLPRCLGQDGEFPEAGPYVQEYALMNAGIFFEALRSVTGEDLLTGSEFSRVPEFLLNIWSPTEGSGFDEDMTGFDLAEGMNHSFRPLMFRFASRLGNPLYQWFCLHDGVSEPGSDNGKRYPGFTYYPVEKEYPAAWEYLWYDASLAAVEPPPKQASAHMRDLGWVALKDGWSRDSNFMMLRGGTSTGPHDRLDQNKFVIYGKGEPLIEPIYGPNYIHFEHFKYTPGSNTILVDGQGQTLTIANGHERFEAEYKTDKTPGAIVHFESHDDFDYVVSDAHRAYPNRLDKFRRHVVFIKNQCFIVFDELESPQPAEFEWLLHSYGQIDADGDRVTVTKNEAWLSAQVVWPRSPTYRFRTSPPDYDGNQIPYLAISPAKETQSAQFLVGMWPLSSGENPGSFTAEFDAGIATINVEREGRFWRAEIDSAGPSLKFHP